MATARGGASYRVAFATMATLPEGPADDQLTFAELRRNGIVPVPAVWDDAAVDWSSFDLVLLRSTWDYHRRREEFLRWVDRADAASTVLNPPALVRWNSHKGYLLELARAGHDVVPTELVPSRSAESLAAVTSRRGWAEAVVKPAVSASSEGLFFVHGPPGAADETKFGELRSSGDVLVQPYLPDGRALGERSLIFFDGRFSHSAEYPYLLNEGIRSERYPRARTPSPEELDRCRRILGDLPVTPLYARLDFMPAGPDRWVLGELELVEPELLFRGAPGAVVRFRGALAERLARA